MIILIMIMSKTVIIMMMMILMMIMMMKIMKEIINLKIRLVKALYNNKNLITKSNIILF